MITIKEIPLSQGKVALVDDEDYEWLSKKKWAYNAQRGCAFRLGWSWDGTHRSSEYMHRTILNAPRGMVVDHKDGNPLNNTRANLRLCSSAQNSRNMKKCRTNTTSRFKGVSWFKRHQNWSIYIKCEQHKYHLGYSDNETEAAEIYDEAADKLFGDFALLNFPERRNQHSRRVVDRVNKALRNVSFSH